MLALVLTGEILDIRCPSGGQVPPCVVVILEDEKILALVEWVEIHRLWKTMPDLASGRMETMGTAYRDVSGSVVLLEVSLEVGVTAHEVPHARAIGGLHPVAPVSPQLETADAFVVVVQSVQRLYEPLGEATSVRSDAAR